MSTWVLLRGLTREAAHWDDFAQRVGSVEPGAEVVALDLPGAGTRWRERAPLNVETVVERCRTSTQLRPPLRLVGLSLGGIVAAHWALSRPEEVSHCVLINSSLRPLARLDERLRPSAWPVLLRLLVGAGDAESRILALTSRDPWARASVLAEWERVRAARPVSRLNALRQLLCAARYRMPPQRPAARLLVLCSAGDRLVNPICSQRLAAQWGCALAMHPSAGHDLPLDEPEWIVEQLRRGFSAEA
jgi:pimeloyl-ACP methyl ester carboxylesterase